MSVFRAAPVAFIGTSLLALSIALGASSVQAQDYPVRQGWYVGGEFGLSLPSDNHYQNNLGLNLDDHVDNGVNYGLVLGYDADRWRYELGYRQRHTSFDSLAVAAGGPLALSTGNQPADGNIESQTLAASALYKIFDQSGWRFFAGGGAGLAHGEINNLRTGGITILDDDHWTLAAHAKAELLYSVTQNIDLGVGYRFERIIASDWQVNPTGTGRAGIAEFGLNSHDIYAKLTWHFGAQKPAAKAAPAPVAVAAPAPVVQAPPPPAPAPIIEAEPIPGPFLVFFDFDRSTITAQAMQILQKVAEVSRDLAPIHIKATGHADRSGPEGYNLRLSERRAEAVRTSLVMMGLKASQITIDYKGENDPLIATDDGIREPQNRRVEIILDNQ